MTLEITITHKLDLVETKNLLDHHRIGLHWKDVRSGKDKKPSAVKAWKAQEALFRKMGQEGAAVIAAYKSVTKPSLRLTGYVDTAPFDDDNGLFCLQLTKVREVNSAVGFFGNLAPRSCTIQTCDKRANGMLADWILDKPIRREVDSLHHRDLELLVTNYLMSENLCKSMWRGGQAYEAIDHAGWMPNGKILLAQTTRSGSADIIQEKLEKLQDAAQLYPDAALYFFGPKKFKSQGFYGIEYIPIEVVFSELHKTDAGKWLINRMFPEPSPSAETK